MGKDRGYLAGVPEAKRLRPSGWSLLGKAKVSGAGQYGLRPHSLVDWGVAEGQCGRGRGSEWAGSGRRRGLLEAGEPGVWLTLPREAGKQPQKGVGP